MKTHACKFHHIFIWFEVRLFVKICVLFFPFIAIEYRWLICFDSIYMQRKFFWFLLRFSLEVAEDCCSLTRICPQWTESIWYKHVTLIWGKEEKMSDVWMILFKCNISIHHDRYRITNTIPNTRKHIFKILCRWFNEPD